jgi:hypothetical protein
MTKVYTIQNEHGDKCFIQYFENGREYDEIIGWGGSCEHNPEYNYLHCVISEEEYNAIKCLHEMLDDTNYTEIYDLLEMTINNTLKKNRNKILTSEDIRETLIEKGAV